MSSNGQQQHCPLKNHIIHSSNNGTNSTPKQSREEFLASFKRPDLPSRCTWTHGGSSEPDPHHHTTLKPRSKLASTLLDSIGHTPLVKLQKIPESVGLKCNLYAKCEYLNPGGSVKDRIGLRMIEEAERKGLLRSGSTIIEPTSGNTGIGLALVAAIKGYKCVIVMPEKMSNEKLDTLNALGAKVVRTPTGAGFDSPESHIAVAQRLEREIPNSIVLNQYTNAGNPLAHYDGTGAEILDQLEGKVDMVVVGTGTGGTITGIGRKIKDVNPNCIVIGADPHGSILAEPEELNKSDVRSYETEGIGNDFVATVIDRSVVDRWVKINDQASFTMARRLACEEGFLCGGSSGANVTAALEAAKDLKEGQNCVVILPDTCRNYLTKFVSDNWMEARNLKPSVNVHGHKWWNDSVTTLDLKTPLTVGIDVSIAEVMNILKTNAINQLPVIDQDGSLKGMVYLPHLESKLLNCIAEPTDSVSRAIFKQFVRVDRNDCLGHVSRILEKDPFVLITQKEKKFSDVNNYQTKETVTGIVTQRDMLGYLARVEDEKNCV